MARFGVLSVIILSIFTGSELWGTKAETGDAVLDTAGENVVTAKLYNILPAIPGQDGGGVTLSSPNGTCPLSVALDIAVSNGLPVIFYPSNTLNGGVVNESMGLNIMFPTLTICSANSVWKLGDADGKSGRRYVMTGGWFGTSESLFSIEKYGGNYALVFNGEVQANGPVNLLSGSSGKASRSYIGVFDDHEQTWLVLSDEPFLVKFKRTVGVGNEAMEM